MTTAAVIQKRKMRLWRLGVTIALVIAVMVTGFFNASPIVSSWHSISSASKALMLLAVLATSLTFLLAAGTYMLLALKPIRYLPTLCIELAAAFVNRLLPAGLGGLSLHGMYLHRHKHTPAQAIAVVSTNNLLGIVGHVVLLGVVLALWPQYIATLHLRLSLTTIMGIACLLVALGLTICLHPRLKAKVLRFIRNFTASLRHYRSQPMKTLAALVIAMMITLTYTTVLYICSRAIGLHLLFSTIFIIYSAGVLFGAITPTPGGLVGVEAGLYAGFMSQHVMASPALATVALFRAITYWLPLAPGVIALFVARKRGLL